MKKSLKSFISIMITASFAFALIGCNKGPEKFDVNTKAEASTASSDKKNEPMPGGHTVSNEDDPIVDEINRPGLKLPVSGGITDHTDYDAPKEIKSKDIIYFSTDFYLEDEIDENRNGHYNYKIELTDGKYICTASGVYDHEIELTKEQVDRVQTIIEVFELVKLNGLDKTTGGLPPEYGPMYVYVTYESDEKLSVRENGAPDIPQNLEFRNLFDEFFTAAGFDDAKPCVEAYTIEDVHLEFNIDNYCYIYGVITDTDEEECFFSSKYNKDTDESEAFILAHLDKEVIFTAICDIIKKYDLDVLNAQNVSFAGSDSDKDYVNIYIDFENSRQIYGEFKGDEIPQEWLDARVELRDCMDEYIQANFKKKGL